jgi:hypothetical protein
MFNPSPAAVMDLAFDTLAVMAKMITTSVAGLLFKSSYHNAYVRGLTLMVDCRQNAILTRFATRREN